LARGISDDSYKSACRDKQTHESRGFAYIAYEDQRSTDVAVDNLNGFSIDDRMMAVDHVKEYKRLVDNPDALNNPLKEPPALTAAKGANWQERPAGYTSVPHRAEEKHARTVSMERPRDTVGGLGERGGQGISQGTGASSLFDMLAEVEGELANKRSLQPASQQRPEESHKDSPLPNEDPITQFYGIEGRGREEKKVKKDKEEKKERRRMAHLCDSHIDRGLVRAQSGLGSRLR
jgi:RNA recognition motif-containing protein